MYTRCVKVVRVRTNESYSKNVLKKLPKTLLVKFPRRINQISISYNMFVNQQDADFITRAIKGVFTVGM